MARTVRWFRVFAFQFVHDLQHFIHHLITMQSSSADSLIVIDFSSSTTIPVHRYSNRSDSQSSISSAVGTGSVLITEPTPN